MSTKTFRSDLCTAWPTRKIFRSTSAPLFRTQASSEQVATRGNRIKRVKHDTRSPSSMVFGDPVGCNATVIQFMTSVHTEMLQTQELEPGAGTGTRGKNEYRTRTSLSALKFQMPYVAPMIPAKAMAVLAFQLEGRVHQPPKRYQPEFREVVTAQSGNGERSRSEDL